MKKLTPLQKAAKRILAASMADQLGAFNAERQHCMYRQVLKNGKEKFCAIGCILPKSVLNDIDAKGLHNKGYVRLTQVFPGLQEKVGLSHNEAGRLQCLHDRWVMKDEVAEGKVTLRRFRDNLRKIIAGQAVTVDGMTIGGV